MTKAERKAAREADVKALDAITADTIQWAEQLGGTERELGISMCANGETLADKLGHGFDTDVIEAWEAKVTAQFRAAKVKAA